MSIIGIVVISLIGGRTHSLSLGKRCCISLKVVAYDTKIYESIRKYTKLYESKWLLMMTSIRKKFT